MRITKFINRTLAIALLSIAVNISYGQEVVDKIVAKVDDYIILKSEVEQSYAGFLASGQADQFSGDARCFIIKQMVETKLMMAMADIDSVEIDPARVDYELNSRMQGMMQRLGSEKAIQQAYGKSVDQLMSELRPSVEEQIKVRAQEDNILSSVAVTPSEIRKFYNSIPKDSLPLFNTEYEIGIIVKKPEASKGEVQKAKDELLKIRQRAINGESFEILATEFSQGPSAANGGNLNFSKRGTMDPAYEAGALALKPGEISMPIVSSFGIHLIQLLEKRGNEYNSRHIIISPKASAKDVEKTQAFLDSLRNEVLSDNINFASTAQQYSDDESTRVNGGFLTDQFGASKIPADGLDPTMYFAIDAMNVGDISKAEIIDLPNGEKVVQMLYYKAKTRPHKANLTDDYEKLKAATIQMKKGKKRSEYIVEKMKEVYIMVDPEFNRCEIVKN